MRTLLSALAALAFIAAPVFGADAPAAGTAKATNATCFCGQPVDAKAAPVTIKDGDHSHTYAVCCAGCATKLSAMKPEDAKKANADKNK